MPEINPDIFAKCAPTFATDVERCGSLTVCNISPTTQDELEAIYTDASDRYRIIGALLEADFTAKACSIRTNGMYDWLAATRKEWSRKNMGSMKNRNGKTEFMPFVKGRHKNPINNEFWTATYVSNSGDNYTYDIVSQGSMPADVNWFPVGLHVFIEGVTNTGTKTHTAFEVVSRTATSSTTVRAVLALKVAGSAFTGSQILPPGASGTQTKGLLVRGVPNINDYEKYCSQIPGLNTNQDAFFWVQSTRYSICTNDLVQKYIGFVLEGNPYYKNFQHVEEVEINRQIIQDFQARHAYDFWFAKPISASQTPTEWDNLESIVLPTVSGLDLPFEGACVGRRANAVGVLEQLRECDRVQDLQGGVLDLAQFFGWLYDIYRVRKANGTDANVIEVFTNSAYANVLATALITYYNQRAASLLKINIDLSANFEQGPFGFKYRKFTLDYPAGVELRIVTHEFFDDYVTAHQNVTTSGGTMYTQGNLMIIPDWSTIYQAVLESNSVTNSTGDIADLSAVNQDYLCVMKTPRQVVKMTSIMYTTVVECPKASLVIENFACSAPTVSLASCPNYYA